MIQDVKIKILKVIPDERGRLMEMLRSDDDFFVSFGQVYMTLGYPGVVKGWHFHKDQYDHFVVVKGMIKLVLFDNRLISRTYQEINEFFIGEYNNLLIQIPPLVIHGFKAIGNQEAIIINVSSEPYNYKEPDEFRIHPYENDIPYKWDIKEG